MTKLLLIADVSATPKGEQVLLSKKFVTGMQMYAEHWPGELHAVLRPENVDPENLDVREWKRGELGFELEVREFEGEGFRAWLRELSPDVVMGGANDRIMDIVDQCDAIGARFVCCTEYNFKTNFQIIAASKASRLQKLRSGVWMTKHMWQRREIVRRSAGLQTNGTPTYDEYRGDNANTLLYFDSRIRADMIVTAEEREARLKRMNDPSRPPRLMFSGRLNAMKGADHLIDVALELRRRGAEFRFDICGDGTLRADMQSRVRSLGLRDYVEFKGILDFEAELVPYVRKETDLFICCHRQGDPSCTYLETAACGVPILGYDNDAFVGILQRYKIGVSSPMDDPVALADVVQDAIAHPERMADYIGEGVRFAEENTYDRVFAQRIAHVRSVCGI